MSGRAQGYFSCGRFCSAVSVLGSYIRGKAGAQGGRSFGDFSDGAEQFRVNDAIGRTGHRVRGPATLHYCPKSFIGSWSSWVAVILWNYMLFRPPFLDRPFCESGSKPHRPTDSLARRDVAQTCPYWQA
jgi:hypothetical protein